MGPLAFPSDEYDPRLDAKTAASIANTRDVLRNNSTLDASQAGALVDSLTREVSPNQGPTGTSKFVFPISFVALAHLVRFRSPAATCLLRALMKNNISRILMIAFRSLLQSPMFATHRGMTGIWTQVNKRLSSIIRPERYR